MDISLNGDFEKFINEQMATGAYNSANDIIQEALSLLISKKQIPVERIAELNKEIELGLADLEAGRVMDGETAFRELLAKYE